MKSNEESYNLEDSKNMPDEIDLKRINQTLFRNKNLIIKIFLIFITISGIIAFSKKKIWKGEFQIVLENNNLESSALMNSEVAGLAGLQGDGNFLETQVGILESPSVLLNVFEFLKNEKKLLGKNVEKLKFNDWRKSIDVRLKKRTSILNLSYKDSHKDLILPVLDKISKQFQDYSGKNRLRSIQLALDYSEKQIPIYKEKSAESLKEAQKFAILQDLSILPGDSEIDKEIPNSINIELIRVEAANEIRNIDMKLKIIEDIGDDSERLMYLGMSIPELVDQGLPQTLDSLDRELINLKNLKNQIKKLDKDPVKIQYFGREIPQLVETGLPQLLKDIETQLAFNRKNYTNEDKIIKNLLRRRETLIDVFKKQAVGYLDADIEKNLIAKPKFIELLKLKAKRFLEAKKITAEANFSAAERPPGVIIKYKQLLANALRDKTSLDLLETNYRSLLLEKARIEDPWELITNPTLLPNPIEPRKKRIIAIGGILGIFVGAITALIIEKRKDILYSKDDLSSISNLRNLGELFFEENNKAERFIKFLFLSQIKNCQGSVAFLFVDLVEKIIIDKLKILLEGSLPNSEFLVTDDVLDCEKYSNIILCVNVGTSKISKCENIYKNILTLKKEVIGIICIVS